MTAKEIAEKILEDGFSTHGLAEYKIYCTANAIDLARAYLELLSRYESEHRFYERQSELHAKEVTKMKEGIKVLHDSVTSLSGYEFSLEVYGGFYAAKKKEIFKTSLSPKLALEKYEQIMKKEK